MASGNNEAIYHEPRADDRGPDNQVRRTPGAPSWVREPLDASAADDTLRRLARRDRARSPRGRRMRLIAAAAATAGLVAYGGFSGAFSSGEPSGHAPSGISRTVDSSPSASGSTSPERQISPEVISKLTPITDRATGYIREVGIDLSKMYNNRLIVGERQVKDVCDSSSSIVQKSPLVDLSFADGQTVSDFLAGLQGKNDADLRKYFYSSASSTSQEGFIIASVDATFDPTGQGLGDVPFTTIGVSRSFNYDGEGRLTSQDTLTTSINNQNEIGASGSDSANGYNFDNLPGLLQKLEKGGFIPLDPAGKDEKPSDDPAAKSGKEFIDKNGTKVVIGSDGYLTITYAQKIIQPSELPNLSQLEEATTVSQEAAVLGDAMNYSKQTTFRAKILSLAHLVSSPFHGKQKTHLENINDIVDPDSSLQDVQALYVGAAEGNS